VSRAVPPDLRTHRRLDVVVDSVAGEDPPPGNKVSGGDLRNADAMFRQGLTSRIITAKRLLRWR
jgi:hypothetical protein